MDDDDGLATTAAVAVYSPQAVATNAGSSGGIERVRPIEEPTGWARRHRGEDDAGAGSGGELARTGGFPGDFRAVSNRCGISCHRRTPLLTP